MNSERISIIALEPFINKFVLAIIKSIQNKNLSHEKKYTIHSDLVPKVSEKVMQASLGEKIRSKDKTTIIFPKRNTNKLIAPIIQSKIIHQPSPQIIPHRTAPKRINQPIQRTIQRNVPSRTQVRLIQKYGKITLLLNDPSISTIECQGAGKLITIIRAGQRQMTKISLNTKEIKEILQKISDATHIPILEGVFRTSVDNFFINAVISEMIGSRFVIRKQTAYSMLER